MLEAFAVVEVQKPVAFIDIDKTAYGGGNGIFLRPIIEGLVADDILSEAAYLSMVGLYDGSNPEGHVLSPAEKRLLFHIKCAKDLKGKSHQAARESARNVLRAQWNNFYPFVAKFIADFQGSHDIFIASGQPDFSALEVAAAFGIGCLATKYAVSSDEFTGEIEEEAFSCEGKHALISPELSKRGKRKSIFIGDSEGDIDCLREVDYGFCVNPDEQVEAHPDRGRWRVLNPETERAATVIYQVYHHRELFVRNR